MYTREQLSGIIENYIAALPLPSKPVGLYEPIRYALQQGGKRIRPALMLMACDAFSGQVESAMHAAAAVEVYHNFTLLHDDLMDNAEVRRGMPVVHKKWNANTAILSGDAMVIYSYDLIRKTAPEHLAGVMAEFAKMILEVCEGQQYDMDFESRDDVTIEEYMEMIRLKTAVLFAGSAKIGAMIAGANEADCDKLYEFGLNLGLAFQLQDDYLDTYGSSEVLGKTIGGDIAEGKKTFLAVSAMNEAGAATRRVILETAQSTTISHSHKITRIKTIYNSLEIPEKTIAAVNDLLGKASAALDGVSLPAERLAELRGVVESISNRNN